MSLAFRCRFARLVISTLLAALGAGVCGAPLASAGTRVLGLQGWQVQSTASVAQSGSRVSRAVYNTSGWLHVRPDDGGAVGTEVGALVQNGRCPKVFYSQNMAVCFGQMSTVGPDTLPLFSVPWWFRTDFRARHGSNQFELIVNGVVGEADVWLNGREIATHATVVGDFTRFDFDITRLVRPGENALAFKLYPNDPNTMFTLDNVDWTQIPPDNNTGIQFPVELVTSGPLALSNAHVVQNDTPRVTRAALTLKADVTNRTDTRQTGRLSAVVRSPRGRAITVAREVTVPANATRTFSFAPAGHPRLNLSHPDVWWPYQMGGQPLYSLRMSISQRGAVPDAESESFGIRTITTRLVGATPGPLSIAPYGSRQFLVNGVPFVFRGGGWSENLFLSYSAADTTRQIQMIKNLGLNGIRTEGKQMPQNFYDQMDSAGILIDAGFQCCDVWDFQSIGLKKPTAADYRIIANSSLAIAESLRNHPSVMNFSWSDDNPVPHQEEVTAAAFRQADFQDPLISSAEYNSAVHLGPSGEKEGPYDWVPPSYWYDAKHYDPKDPTRTNVGGAWAFNSEASAGATVPTLDSIRRWLSPLEQRELWQNPDANQYHLNYEDQLPGPQNYGYAFGTLHDLDAAIKARYGGWSNLAQYVEEAQLQNYETQRSEFEAYIDHSTDRYAPSTGIDYWQLNKGWPSLLWDLYNYDFDQAGSYFGAKEANRSLHALYTYDDGSVAVDNLSRRTEGDLSVVAKVYDVAGGLLSEQTSTRFSVGPQGVERELLHPVVPAATHPPQRAQTYFVELQLFRAGSLVDRNVYWLSTQGDLVNWKATIGQPQAKMTRYANLTQLHQLAGASVRVTAASHAAGGAGNEETEVTLTNTSTHSVALFLRADVRRGSGLGKPAHGDNGVLPVQWNNDDITLFPAESQTLTATYRRSALRGGPAVVSVSAWNLPTRDVAAEASVVSRWFSWAPARRQQWERRARRGDAWRGPSR